MKRNILFVLCTMTALYAGAQQLQTSSFYDVQAIIHNPSAAGTQETNVIGVAYRSQWSGISGGPQTSTAFGSFDVPSMGIGIGGSIYRDKTGPTSRTGMALSLAKHIKGQNGVFSIGIENRIQQFSVDKGKLADALANDPVLGGSDNSFKYDAGFGISYTNKHFEAGASVAQLIQSKLGFYSGSLSTTEQAMLYRHYYLHGLYNWNVDGTTVITPNALFIYLPNSPLYYQVGARVEFNKLFWVGGGYHAQQNFMLSAGVHVAKKLTVGYAYNSYNTPVSSFDKGSGAHEVLLRYDLQK